MPAAKTVLVVGTGTIGEPLIGLLCTYREQLGIDEVIFLKKTPLLIDRAMVADLVRRGALLATSADTVDEFTQIGLEVSYTIDEALERATVVIDCTPFGNDMKEELYCQHEDSTKLFIAQGTQFGFGACYARGINDSVLHQGDNKYLHVVSCNTHSIAALIATLAGGEDDMNNLRRGRFLCMRRANDISQNDRFVPSPELSVHNDERFGSHHARDVWHLFHAIGYDLDLFSSSLRLPTQLMHVVHFNLSVDEPTTVPELIERIEANERLALTYKHSVNSIFSFGRDHGFYGRIMNQAVVSADCLHVGADGHEITGYSFTPQDGNSLISSVAATIWALYPETYNKIIQCLRPFFFAEV